MNKYKATITQTTPGTCWHINYFKWYPIFSTWEDITGEFTRRQCRSSFKSMAKRKARNNILDRVVAESYEPRTYEVFNMLED